MATILTLSEPARDRIVRVTNVHFDADEQFIESLFDGLTIDDQFRTINTQLNGHIIVDREIKIQPARDGNFALNESETAFVRPATKKRPNRRMRIEDPVAPEASGSPSATFKDSDFPALGPTPATEETYMKAPAVHAPISGNLATHLVATESDFATAIGNLIMNPAKDVEDQKDEYMGFEEGHTDKREADEFASAHDTAFLIQKRATQATSVDQTTSTISEPPRGLPAGVNPNILPAPRNKNWNLKGHDPNDRSKNVITPGDWYSFGGDDFRDVEAEQKATGTNAGRIVKNNGGFDAKDNDKFTKK